MASSSELKSERSKKIAERDLLEKRKQEVDSITCNINSEINDYIINVNNMISSCSSMLESGLKGKKESIAEDILDEQEMYVSTDAKLSSSNSKLSEESSRCQSKITELNSEISSLDSQIQEAERQEEEERRRAVEESLATLTGGTK